MRAFLACECLVFAVLVCCLPARADETGRPTGENCLVASPPVTAGEVLDQGTTLRVYPRAKDIARKYTGCQSRWRWEKDRWQLAKVVSIIEGEPMTAWSPAVSVITCLYDKGKLIQGEAANCPEPQSLILKSRASGCLDKIQRVAAQGGNKSPSVPGCEPE